MSFRRLFDRRRLHARSLGWVLLSGFGLFQGGQATPLSDQLLHQMQLETAFEIGYQQAATVCQLKCVQKSEACLIECQLREGRHFLTQQRAQRGPSSKQNSQKKNNSVCAEFCREQGSVETPHLNCHQLCSSAN